MPSRPNAKIRCLEQVSAKTEAYIKSVLLFDKSHPSVLFVGKSVSPSVDFAKLKGLSRAVDGIPLPIRVASRNTARSLPLAQRVCALTMVAAKVCGSTGEVARKPISEQAYKKQLIHLKNQYHDEITPRSTLLRARELLQLSNTAHLVLGVMEVDRLFSRHAARDPLSPWAALDELEAAVGIEWRHDPNVTVVYFGDRILKCFGSQSTFNHRWILL